MFGVFFLQHSGIVFQFLKRQLPFQTFVRSRLVKATLVYIGFLFVFFLALRLINVKPNGFSIALILNRSVEFLLDLKYDYFLSQNNRSHSVFPFLLEMAVFTRVISFGVSKLTSTAKGWNSTEALKLFYSRNSINCREFH